MHFHHQISSIRPDKWLLSTSQYYEMLVISTQKSIITATAIYILGYNNIYSKYLENSLDFIEYSFPIINIILVGIFMADGIFYSIYAAYYKLKGLQYMKFYTNEHFMTIRDSRLQFFNPQLLLSINQGVTMMLLWSFELISTTRVTVQQIIPPIGFICVVYPISLIAFVLTRIFINV